jgi:outer membrane protein W
MVLVMATFGSCSAGASGDAAAVADFAASSADGDWSVAAGAFGVVAHADSNKLRVTMAKAFFKANSTSVIYNDSTLNP